MAAKYIYGISTNDFFLFNRSLSSSSVRSGKKLQTLQPSAKNQKLLVGSDGVVRLGSQGKKKDIKIYEVDTIYSLLYPLKDNNECIFRALLLLCLN